MIFAEPFNIKWFIIIVMMGFYATMAVVTIYLTGVGLSYFARIDSVVNFYTSGNSFWIHFTIFAASLLSQFTLVIAPIIFTMQFFALLCLLVANVLFNKFFSIFDVSFCIIFFNALLALVFPAKGVSWVFIKLCQNLWCIAFGTSSFDSTTRHLKLQWPRIPNRLSLATRFANRIFGAKDCFYESPNSCFKLYHTMEAM